jgi:transposase InsO family protein
MAAKKAGLKKVRRKEWRVQREELAKENPLILHTDAGRTFSMVRRMKAEKKMGIPISLRSGFAISTANGKAANEMTEGEWEEFYDALSKHLRRNCPGLYALVFWAQ